MLWPTRCRVDLTMRYTRPTPIQLASYGRLLPHLGDVRSTYANDADAKQLLNYFAATSDKSRQKLAKPLRSRLKFRITYEYHDAPTSGHPGREKTYLLLTRDFYWSHQYKWVRKYVRACEVCQRVKPSPFSQAPLRSLPTPPERWQSISMNFVFGLPPDNKRRTGIVVFVDRFSKMVHLAAVPVEVTAKQTTRLFVDMVFRYHGMPIDIVSDRHPRFTARFWQDVFTLLGTQLSMSTADHSQTDRQTERVNRVLVDALKSYAHSFHRWSDCLPMAEFAINNSGHVSTGHTVFYVNALHLHPRVPSELGALCRHARGPRAVRSTRTVSTPGVDTLNLNEQHTQAGPVVNKDAELNPKFSPKAMDFFQHRQAVIRFVQDAIAASVDRQKLNADNNGRGNTNELKVGSLVLLATQHLAKHAVFDVGASKLAPRFIGPFTVLAKHGNAYTLDIPSSLRLHPTFYVGRLKSYAQHESPTLGDLVPTPARGRRRALARHSVSTQGRPARSRQSARPARAEPSTGPAPASTQQTRPSGGVQQPPDDQRSLVDQTRVVFPPPLPPRRDAQGAIRWIVQPIVDRRIRTQGPDHFRRRWKGFSPSHDTWEPRNVLMRDVPKMVTEYEACHHQSRRRA
ncbi:unnamed protein product [Phytophthora fragariaefolia]|uniref:Unnamed protein product n=1 Tax=Phytophthora fragariaefolia TaxID=1490495 RepID=A0A9W7CX98_9STRA|nr:unnamed protein product [Phytophthora fragariaefolia]